MSPATPWTELTAPETPWVSGFPIGSSGSLDAVIIHGVALPVVGYASFADSTTPYTKLSIGATAHTELSVAATTWVELSG